MFSTKDSIYDLRVEARKRKGSFGGSPCLPIDQLRDLAKKRQRVIHDYESKMEHEQPKVENVSHSCSEPQLERSISVHFDLTRNVYNERTDSSDEELDRCWLSAAESENLKTELRLIILAMQHGVLDTSKECVRGLEAHRNASITKKKKEKGKSYMSQILQQQRFLKTIMGKANDLMLSKLSSFLSAEDSTDASKQGIIDANEAMLIHASVLEETGDDVDIPKLDSGTTSSIMSLLLQDQLLKNARATCETLTTGLGIAN